MKANLNVYILNSDKVKIYLADAYKKGIKLLPPSVNKSGRYFEVDGKNAIRFGLKGIKNVGATSELIIREREARGEFKSYQDFVERIIIHENLKKNVLESLILAGALDEFEGTRRAKLSVMDKMMESSKVDKKAYDSGQITMFDLAESLGCSELTELKVIKIPKIEEFDKKILLESEKEYNGYYITEHPLDSYAKILKDEEILPLMELVNIVDEDNEVINSVDEDDMNVVSMSKNYNNEEVKVAGVVRDAEMKFTRKGKAYMRFKLEDTTGEIECKLFKMEMNSELIRDGERLIVVGTFQDNEFGKSIIANNVSDLSIMGNLAEEITVIGYNDVIEARKQWQQLLAVAKLNRGNVTIRFLQNGNKHEFPVKIKLNPLTLSKIQRIFGENNCRLAS